MKQAISVSLAITVGLVCADVMAQVSFKPCRVFEVEESFTPEGGEAQSRTQTYFTEAELPWTPLSLFENKDYDGVAYSIEPVEIDFDGKKNKGKKLTWKHDISVHPIANINVMKIEMWIANSVPTPDFRLTVPGGPDLRIPRGCVRVEVTPHTEMADKISKSDLKSSFSMSGHYGRSLAYRVGQQSFSAHAFTYSMKSSESNVDGMLTVSKSMPGRICRMQVEIDDKRNAKGRGVMKIVRINDVGVPTGIDVFSKFGFAFKPPDSYRKTSELAAGEIVRYTTDSGAFISVSQFELGTGGLKELFDRQNAQRDPKISIVRRDHLAAQRTFRNSNDAKVGRIFAEYNGRGYNVAISGLDRMRPAKVGDLLKGWRWIDIKQE